MRQSERQIRDLKASTSYNQRITDKQLDELGRIMHGAVETILASWSTMVDLARAPDLHTPERVGGNAQGGHSDPTSAAALRQMRAGGPKDWQRAVIRTVSLAQNLEAQAIQAIDPYCPNCDQPIRGRPFRTIDRVTRHVTCPAKKNLP